MLMQKLLIPITVIASLLLGACSNDPVVNRLPWVYRIEIQQGNVVSQEEANQLRIGMTRRQVQFILGSPMVTDPFHPDRWDYYFSYKPGTRGEGEPEQELLTLFFREDELVRMAGSVQPGASPDNPDAVRQQRTVTVPPQERGDVGILTRLWRWIGFGNS